MLEVKLMLRNLYNLILLRNLPHKKMVGKICISVKDFQRQMV
jgi:hypothetical protein